ncbi:SLATT domain-containing protein, partial [Streptomyces sp. NPDC004976]
VEFRSGGAPLGVQTAVAGGGRPESTLPHGRFPSPPGPSRPNMPRQRPPEPR